MSLPKRVRYFPGQLLGIDDFRSEQNYLLEKQRLRNSLTPGAGVVAGLKVATRRDGIHVTPGIAIDSLGREIVVTDPQIVPYPVNGSAASLVLAYTETPTDPVPVAANGLDALEFTRIQEGFVLGCLPPTVIRAEALTLAKLTWSRERWRIARQRSNTLIVMGAVVLLLTAIAKLIRPTR